MQYKKEKEDLSQSLSFATLFNEGMPPYSVSAIWEGLMGSGRCWQTNMATHFIYV